MKQQEQLKAMEQYAKRVLDSDTSGMIGRILNESSIQQRRLQKPKGQIYLSVKPQRYYMM